MPEMQDFDDVGALPNSIVDYDRGVDQLADTRTSLYKTADIGKALQDVYVIQDRIAKPLGVCWKLRPGIRKNFLEIR